MDEITIYGGDRRQLWGFILLSRELGIKSELGTRGPGVGACCLNPSSSHQVFCSPLVFQCPSQWSFTIYQYPLVLYLRTTPTYHSVTCLCKLVTHLQPFYPHYRILESCDLMLHRHLLHAKSPRCSAQYDHFQHTSISCTS